MFIINIVIGSESLNHSHFARPEKFVEKLNNFISYSISFAGAFSFNFIEQQQPNIFDEEQVVKIYLRNSLKINSKHASIHIVHKTYAFTLF